MIDDLKEASLLFLPLLLGYTCHGVCMRTGFLRGLARPLDGGATWRGARVFGDNKTYRGLVVVAAGTAAGFLLMAVRYSGSLTYLPPAPWAASLGFGVGLGAMLGELPNSLLKRQLGIAPGSQSSGTRAFLFHILDQVDVMPGAWLVLSSIVVPRPRLVLASVLFMFVAHQAITIVGYALGMRATWR